MRRPADAGAAAVEFALVALLFFTLVMGVLEFGRAWAIQGSLAQAARDTAREMAIHDKPDEARSLFLSTFRPLAAPTPTTTSGLPLNVAVSRVGEKGDPGCRAVVNATFVAGSLTGFFGDTFTVGAEGAMRCGG